MSRKQFNPLELIFSQIAFKRDFIEKHPQCAECEHIQELVSDWRFYNDCIKVKYCPTCPYFEEAK